MRGLGLLRVAAVTPQLKVANTEFNTEEIIRCIKEADENGASVILFPELALTGYTCGDLFYQGLLYEKSLESLKHLVQATKGLKAAVILGFHLKLNDSLYNCAAFIQGGRIRGIVPKMFLSNEESQENRWFAPGISIADQVNSVTLFGYDIPFGHVIFQDEEHQLKLGIEIAEDMALPISPGSHLALQGAHILFNPAASSEAVGKSRYRQGLIRQESKKSLCGYVYASAGTQESTTDLVFGGERIIGENGSLLATGQRFTQNSAITYGEIDYHRIKYERLQVPNISGHIAAYSNKITYTHVAVDSLRVLAYEKDKITRSYPRSPFVPQDPAQRRENCSEIFNIQAAALAKRLTHTKAKKAVIGISGGLDSTLALLVCAHTFNLLKKDLKEIVAVTMPGFGTTDQTYNNALTMMKLLGVDVREVSIKDSVLQHFKDIGHDPAIHDVTYENAQARERTQILMDIANKEGGLVVGTGDLSEVALGWSTYNGDHMSMYGVNPGVPKTLIPFVIQWVMNDLLSDSQEKVGLSNDDIHLKKTLQDVIETPISPELLPPDKDGKIAQKTEDTVGPYILHDFFIFYTLRYGMMPKKLLYVAKTVFEGEYTQDFIKNWLVVFYRRFFSQQFKRSCVPDGPKVGSVALSPRGGWIMPSDGDATLWLQELEE